MSQRLRNFVFTINNYTNDDKDKLLELPYKYLIYGEEVAPTTGTPHLQGYIELDKQMRLSGIKKIIKSIHVEQRLGTAKQAAEYCKKEGKFVEFGTISNPGKRTDLDEVRNLAEEAGLRAVTKVCSAQQIRVAEKYLTYNEEPRNWKPNVIWLWGPTGTGKSREAREITKDLDTYCKNTNNKWWDGYDGQEAIILDDFRDSWMPITDMLGLLDRYEYRLEYKGGFRQCRAKTIVVTSALAPDNCYRNTGEAIEQLIRRIDTIKNCAQKFDSEVEGNTSLDELSKYILKCLE